MFEDDRRDDPLQKLLVDQMLLGQSAKDTLSDLLRRLEDSERDTVKKGALKELITLGRMELVAYWSSVWQGENNQNRGRKVNRMALYTAESIQSSLSNLLLGGLKNSVTIEYLLAEVDDEDTARALALVHLIQVGEPILANIWSQHWMAEKSRMDKMLKEGLRFEDEVDEA